MPDQVKVGRGERAEAYGIAAAEAGLAFIASQAERKRVPRGRRARRGSRYARHGAVLCKETSEAAISRVERRRSRVPRIDAGERESAGNVDRGRAPRHERATDTARVAIRGMFRRRQRGAVTRERGELRWSATRRCIRIQQEMRLRRSRQVGRRALRGAFATAKVARARVAIRANRPLSRASNVAAKLAARWKARQGHSRKEHPMIPHKNPPETRTSCPRHAM